MTLWLGAACSKWSSGCGDHILRITAFMRRWEPVLLFSSPKQCLNVRGQAVLCPILSSLNIKHPPAGISTRFDLVS